MQDEHNHLKPTPAEPPVDDGPDLSNIDMENDNFPTTNIEPVEDTSGYGFRRRHAAPTVVADKIDELNNDTETDDSSNIEVESVDDVVTSLPDNELVQPQKSRGMLVTVFLVTILALLGIAAGVYFYLQAQDVKNESANKSDQISSLQSQLSNSTSNSAGTSKEVTNLQTEAKQLRADLEKAEADLKAAQEEIAKNKPAVESAPKLTTANQQLIETNSTLSGQINSLNERIGRLEAALRQNNLQVPN